MNALETRAAALAAFRDGDSGNTALEGCVRAGVYGMAGFVRVAPAPARVAGGGLAFAESALDHAELEIPNVALTPGRIPRQRHHPGLQSQHSVTTGATPPSASRTTTSPRAIEVTLAVASGTESRIGSPAAAMAVRHLERGILHSCGPTLSAPPWRRLPSRCPEVAASAHIDVMRRAVAAPRDSPASLRVIWTHPPGQYRVVLGRTPPSACGSSQAASRPVGAMETLTKHFESRVGASLERTGLKPSTFGLQAVGYLNPVRQLRPGRSPRLAMACQVPVVIKACRQAQVAPVPSRGNAPRNSSPNRTEADR